MQIYKILNKITNQCYIGKALNGFKNRYKGVYWFNGKNVNSYLKNSIKKYGIDNFDIIILHNIEFKDNELLSKLEKQEILNNNSLYPNGFNFTTGGEGGFTFSDVSLKKMSDSRKGRPQSLKTIEKRSKTLKLIGHIPPKPNKQKIRNLMKLSNRNSVVIRTNIITNEIKVYEFLIDVKKDGFCPSLVSQKCNNQHMKQDYNGFKFEYKNKSLIKPFKVFKNIGNPSKSKINFREIPIKMVNNEGIETYFLSSKKCADYFNLKSGISITNRIKKNKKLNNCSFYYLDNNDYNLYKISKLERLKKTIQGIN